MEPPVPPKAALRLHLPTSPSSCPSLRCWPRCPRAPTRSRTTVHSSTFLYELGGNTPLHLACQEGDEDSMELILTAIGPLSPLSPSPLSCPPAYPPAASIDGSPLTSLTAAPNDAGLTPLDLLVLASHVPDWRHQQLLDRYSALLVGSGEEVEDKARFAGPRRL